MIDEETQEQDACCARDALRWAVEAGRCERRGQHEHAASWMGMAHEMREHAGVPARAPDLTTAERMAQEWRVKYPSIAAAWREANRS